jgi:hypothetical protein
MQMLICITEVNIAWFSNANLTPMKTNSMVCEALYKTYRGIVTSGFERNLMLKMEVRMIESSQLSRAP